jgi:hypothetical protein
MSFDPSLIYRTSASGSWYYDHPKGRLSATGKPRFKARSRSLLLVILKRQLGSAEWAPPIPTSVLAAGPASPNPGS